MYLATYVDTNFPALLVQCDNLRYIEAVLASAPAELSCVNLARICAYLCKKIKTGIYITVLDGVLPPDDLYMIKVDYANHLYLKRI